MDNKDKEALLSYVKVTHVCFIITLVCCLLSLTTIFFRTFFDIPVDFLEEYGIELDFFSILYLFEPSVTQVLGIEWTAKKYRTPLIPGEEVPTEWKRQDEDNLKKFNNNLILLLFFKIMACFLLPLALLGFHFSFWGYIYFCAGFYGYMYNVGFISDLISTIMIILLIIGLTADKRKEAAENRAERKALLKEENERSWREEFTTKILSQVGKISLSNTIIR